MQQHLMFITLTDQREIQQSTQIFIFHMRYCVMEKTIFNHKKSSRVHLIIELEI